MIIYHQEGPKQLIGAAISQSTENVKEVYLSNLLFFQLHICKDLLLFFALRDSYLNIIGFSNSHNPSNLEASTWIGN